MTVPIQLTDSKAQDFANKIGEVFTSLPHLPKNWIEFLVKIVPILALIGAILQLLAGPVLALFSVFTLLTLNPLLVVSTLIAAILSLASAFVLFMAYKPLQNREYLGWMLLFWSHVFGAVETLINIIFRQNGLFGIVGILIGFYILYELRSSYGVKGKVEEFKTEAKKLTN